MAAVAMAATPSGGGVTSSEEAQLDNKKTKSRVKRMEKPVKSDLEAEVARLNEAMDSFQGRINEIKRILDEKQGRRIGSSQEMNEARNRLAQIAAQFRAVVDEKKAIYQELEVADGARENTKIQAKQLREKLPFVCVEEIDEEIKKMELKMAHTTLSLQEEKKVMIDIQNLKKSRSFVKEYHDRLHQSTQDEIMKKEHLAKIKEKDKLLAQLRAQQQEQRDVLALIRAREDSQGTDIPSLIEEKTELLEKIRQSREQIWQARMDFKNKEDEYYQRERVFRDQLREDRNKQYMLREERRKEMDQRRREREEELYVAPYTDEIIQCDQLINYLQKMAPSDPVIGSGAAGGGDGQKTGGGVAGKNTFVVPEGLMVISKKSKDDKELDGWFGGLGGGKKGKKGRGGAGGGAPKTRTAEKLAMSLDALASLEKLSITAPSTVGDLSTAIEKIKEKKSTYQKLQSDKLLEKKGLKPSSSSSSSKRPVELDEAPDMATALSSSSSLSDVIEHHGASSSSNGINGHFNLLSDAAVDVGDVDHQAAGDVDHQAADDDDHQAAGDGDHQAAGDGDHQEAGDGDHQADGDGDHQAAGDGDHQAAGDGDHQAAGDGDHHAASDGDHHAAGDGDQHAAGDGDHQVVGDGDHHAAGDGDRQVVGDCDHQVVGNGNHEESVSDVQDVVVDGGAKVEDEVVGAAAAEEGEEECHSLKKVVLVEMKGEEESESVPCLPSSLSHDCNGESADQELFCSSGVQSSVVQAPENDGDGDGAGEEDDKAIGGDTAGLSDNSAGDVTPTTTDTKAEE